jgi:hypothetical protein
VQATLMTAAHEPATRDKLKMASLIASQVLGLAMLVTFGGSNRSPR